MKLYEAGAVLLIIGSAVVGPIEAQFIKGEPTKCSRPPEMLPGKQCHYGNSTRRETTGETCARAIKEIGARLWHPSDGLDAVLNPAAGGPVLLRETYHLKRREVLCIPAPTGLRR